MIKGKYDLGEVGFVDCNFAYNDISNILHEYMHHKLGTSTIFGFVNFILEQTEIGLNNEDLKKISRTMQKAYLVLNENYALFHQLAIISCSSKDRYERFVTEFKKSENYAIYHGKKILNILSKNNAKDLLETNIINRIAFIAMNIDFTKLSEKDLLNNEYIEAKIIENSKDFDPNERYTILLKSLEKLLNHNDVNNITDDMLLKYTGLQSFERNKENFLKVLNLYKKRFEVQNIDTSILIKNIESIKNTSEDNFILEEVSKKDVYKIFDIIRPMPLNNNYEEFFPNKVTEEHLNCGVMRVLLRDNKNYSIEFYAIVVFYDVILGHEYRFFVDKNSLRDMIVKFNKLIMIYCEYYNRFISEFPIIKSKNIFLEINNTYSKCKEFFINDMSEGRETMIHEGNDRVFFIFSKQKDDNIFVMYFFKEVMGLIKKDIEDKLFNIISVDDEGLDREFYKNNTDWWKYEDIIRVIMGTYIMDAEHKFPTLGRRINIK